MVAESARERKSDGRSRLRRTGVVRSGRKISSWIWGVLAFTLLEGALVQARVIPSGSMENTILIGDHLIVDRLGYSAGIPYSDIQVPLWLNPKRQQIIVFSPPPAEGSNQDLIKRIIGVPGDLIQIRQGRVYVNGKPLAEPYVLADPRSADSVFENFPPVGNVPTGAPFAPAWAATLHRYVTNGQLGVPRDRYFVMGDHRGDSYDSRYWGFVPRKDIIGAPLFVYLSIKAPGRVWEPGHIGQRLSAYLSALIHPREMRWKRIFRTF